MTSKYRDTFFVQKRPWSEYKDLLLGYYLVPYLQKVKRLGQPIVIVDMFAGRGSFESGEPGSPLIIANSLLPLHERGANVSLRCFESFERHYTDLVTTLLPFPFAKAENRDCFDAIDELVADTERKTLLLYVDPCEISQLNFAQLSRLYSLTERNQSVEVLLVFMASAFVRQAAWTRSLATKLEESGALHDPLVRDSVGEEKAMWLSAIYGEEADWFNQVRQSEQLLDASAGGDYWKEVVERASPWESRCFDLVDAYKTRMRRWFRLVESFPIRADSGSAIPKYWVVFGSRYQPALDLFNRAACEAARRQRQNYRQPESLFADLPPQPEAALDFKVNEAVVTSIRSMSTAMSWDKLRWQVCGDQNVGKFTDSEINKSVKRLLKAGVLSGATGDRIEGSAMLSRNSTVP